MSTRFSAKKHFLNKMAGRGAGRGGARKRTPKITWTDEERYFLIDLVEANPPLYDQSHDEYKNTGLCEALWVAISSEFTKRKIPCEYHIYLILRVLWERCNT